MVTGFIGILWFANEDSDRFNRSERRSFLSKESCHSNTEVSTFNVKVCFS